MLAHSLALAVDQLSRDPPIAISLAGLAVDQTYLLGEHLVGHGPGRGGPGAPAVVAAGGDPQGAAHDGDREAGLVGAYELEHRYGVEPVSLANQAAALFRMSRSCSRTLTRRRRRWSSARSLGGRSSTPSGPPSEANSQLRRVWSCTPSPAAISMTGRPIVPSRRTASSRNSGGYAGWCLWGMGSRTPSYTDETSSRPVLRCPRIPGHSSHSGDGVARKLAALLAWNSRW